MGLLSAFWVGRSSCGGRVNKSHRMPGDIFGSSEGFFETLGLGVGFGFGRVHFGLGYRGHG